MKNEKQLVKLQESLDKTKDVNVLEIQKSLVYAMDRTGDTELIIENTIHDILSEFKLLSEDKIKEAIKKGSLGAYGKTYKLTTQEICIWIREYLKQTSKQY